MFTEKSPKPPIIVISGPPKIGKSTFAEQADSPVFLQTEDVGDGIKAPKSDLRKSWAEVMESLAWLSTEKHDFKTLVVDSVDWLEPLINNQVAKDNNVPTLEKIGYGKGYVMALDLWREYIDAIKWLRDTKDMAVIQIAHTEIKRFENPETDPYDRYQLKLYKGASDLVMESSDVIIFANYFVGTTKKKDGMRERTRAIGSGERTLYTEERPAFKAGNRFNLPPEIPFDREGNYWTTIKQHIPYYNQK